MYFDTHVHLNSDQLFENLDGFIHHALENGVENMMVVGYDLPSSKRAVEIASAYDFIYAAVGIGPNDCLNTTDEDLRQIDMMLTHEKVIIGTKCLNLSSKKYLESKSSFLKSITCLL